jgi:hypothetical protein
MPPPLLRIDAARNAIAPSRHTRRYSGERPGADRAGAPGFAGLISLLVRARPHTVFSPGERHWTCSELAAAGDDAEETEMTTYTGGARVQSGYYLDTKSYRFVNVERDGTVLPGPGRVRYVKVPTLAVMAAAPALGGLFVVALPFIGIALTVQALARKVGAAASVGATEMAATVAVPVPVRTKHLTGQAAGEGGEVAATEGEGTSGASGTEKRLEDLQKDIEEQRGVIH